MCCGRISTTPQSYPKRGKLQAAARAPRGISSCSYPTVTPVTAVPSATAVRPGWHWLQNRCPVQLKSRTVPPPRTVHCIEFVTRLDYEAWRKSTPAHLACTLAHASSIVRASFFPQGRMHSAWGLRLVPCLQGFTERTVVLGVGNGCWHRDCDLAWFLASPFLGSDDFRRFKS